MKQPVNDKDAKAETVVRAETVVMEGGRRLPSVIFNLETNIDRIHQRNQVEAEVLVDWRAESASRIVGADKVAMADGRTLADHIELFRAREESFEAELHRVACAQSEAAMRDRGIDRQSHESVQRLIKELHGLLEAQNRRIAHLEHLNDIIFNQELERRTLRTTADPRKTAHGRFDAGEGRRFDVGELGINDRFE